MDVLILAAALWFGYEALKAALAWDPTMGQPTRCFFLFLYCFICTLFIAYEGGWLHSGHGAQAATITHCYSCETAATAEYQEF